MAAKKKVDREMVVDAALNLLRKRGFSSLNVRSITRELSCSTKPIYYLFGSMDGLLEKVKEAAAKVHSDYVRRCMDSGEYDPYRAYGMGFVHFAAEERELFRYLYLYDEKGGKAVDDVHLDEIYEVMKQRYGYEEETARKLHRDMSFFTYGIAMMMNTGYLHMTDEEISRRLHTEFMALTGVYGPPPAYVNKGKQGALKVESDRQTDPV